MTRRLLPLSRLPERWSSSQGLAAADVLERRGRYGVNDIVEERRGAWRELLRDTAGDPMIWFLAGTSALYAAVGQRVEALTLLVAIVPLVGMGLYLHRRTQASTEGLQSRLADSATVARDGASARVPVVDLVPGDLVTVIAGEPFPTDGVVVSGADLQVDESALTGEAYPVGKRPVMSVPGDGDEVPVAAEHWALAGTRLLTGRASVRVVFTGAETLYGEIVRSAVSGGQARTPLQAAIGRLVSVLMVAAAAICLVLAWARLRQGHGWVDALVSAVTLASAALPEEFPVVFTFFLGVGVYRLARRQALVRRAVSVENIGRVSCICSDKTGTMTEGRLRLADRAPARDVADKRLVLLAAGASRPDSHDPLDAAILAESPAAARGVEVLATFPFTEARRRESAVVREDGAVIAVTKGAVETVLAMCDLAPEERQTWHARTTTLAEDARKVIACAWRPLEGWQGGEPVDGYAFAGLLAFEDPVRDGVLSAVASCREAGIHIIMVTGDHPATAHAVARRIGLGAGRPTVISGDDLDGTARRNGALRGVDVIARAAPAQKLSLVRALQAEGEVVAVTGDGVNDVPALQAADIGIAMGERGTRSAREVASIVLLDDNFRTIVAAIREGRQLFDNLRLSFLYLMIIHVPLVVSATFIPLAGYPLLYLPVHIVWLEMIIHPSALLVFQELPAARLAGGPRGRSTRFFVPGEWVSIGLTGGLVTLFVVVGYLWSAGDGGGVEHGRAMALATLTLFSAALTAGLSRLRTRVAQVIAAGTVALSVAVIQTPGLAGLLHLEPLHWDDWALAIAASAVAAAVPLALKALGRR